jgi:hypothetical protein
MLFCPIKNNYILFSIMFFFISAKNAMLFPKTKKTKIIIKRKYENYLAKLVQYVRSLELTLLSGTVKGLAGKM